MGKPWKRKVKWLFQWKWTKRPEPSEQSEASKAYQRQLEDALEEYYGYSKFLKKEDHHETS